MIATLDEVRAAVRDVLSDPIERAALLGNNPFGVDQADMLEKHESQIQSLLNDASLGRALTGPLWLSGASVIDGTITANKITVNSIDAITVNTGDLNVTGNIVAAASYPAVGARVEINSSGIWGYSGAVTTTFKLNTDGSGEIGTGSNKITWNTSGVLSVPAAVISSLTIAEIGSGTLGGTYSTAGSNPRIQLSATQLVAFNSGGSETFKILSSTGAVTMTGSFTVQSAASGARVVLSNAGGIELFNSGGTATGRFNAATGAGFLGATPGTIQWDSSGNATINGNLTIASGGKILDGDLSEWSQSGIILKSSGAFGDTIKWQVSGVDRGSIFADFGSFTIRYFSGGGIVMASSSTNAMNASGEATNLIDTNGDMKAYRRIFPGASGGGQQSSVWFDYDSTNVRITVNGGLKITAGLVLASAAMDYDNTLVTSGGSGALPNPTKYIIVQKAGTPYYIPVFTSPSSWTA